MYVEKLREAGYEEALLGMSLSYYDHAIPLKEFWTEEKIAKAAKQASVLAFKQGGHNKFLESMQVWVFIQATRGFWQEFDTYRVGMTKQSASTMHTLDKRSVTLEDFSKNTSISSVLAFNHCLSCYKNSTDENYKNITYLKDNLPEGWLQERVICTNYKVLQNIYAQRKKHRYKPWQEFLEQLLNQVNHPHFINPDRIASECPA